MSTRPSRTTPSNSPEPAPPWEPVVEIAGALAASVVYLYIAGGLVMWARLHAVDLPADNIVSELPREFLLTTGLTSVIVPVGALALIGALVAAAGLNRENRRANSIFALFAAVVGAAIAIEGDPSTAELIVAGVLLVLATVISFRLEARRPPPSDRTRRVGAALRAALPTIAVALYAAIFLSDNFGLVFVSIVILVLLLPASWWVAGASTTRGQLGRVLLVAGLLGLVFRVASELDAPSPFSPALVYTESTGTCRSSGGAGSVSDPTSARPCKVAGYLIAETDDTVYLAEPSQVSQSLADLRSLGELNGRVSEFPMDAVDEISTIRALQVKRIGQEGEVAPLEGVLGPDDEPSTKAAAAKPSSVDTVRRFAPLVWIHSKDGHGPGDSRDFINGSALKWRLGSKSTVVAPRGQVRAGRLGERCEGDPSGCYEHGGFSARQLTRPHHGSPERPQGLSTAKGFHLDLDDSLRRGDRSPRPQVPVFYELSGRREVRITYWLFYPYSRVQVQLGRRDLSSLFSHEGDWENIDVILTPDLKPLRVEFFGHGKPKSRDWSSICKIVGTREDCVSEAAGHPIVFSARGTHASYPNANDSRNDDSKVCATKRILGFRPCSHDLRNRGRPWKTWAQPVGDAQVQPWYGYGGAWGAATSKKDTTGPLGPSQFKRKVEPQAPLAPVPAG